MNIKGNKAHHSHNGYPWINCTFPWLIEVCNYVWIVEQHYWYLEIQNSIMIYTRIRTYDLFYYISSAVHESGLGVHLP